MLGCIINSCNAEMLKVDFCAPQMSHVITRVTNDSRLRTAIVSNNFLDRKSTRLNSSHSQISYAVFCLKKKDHRMLHLSEHAALEPVRIVHDFHRVLHSTAGNAQGSHFRHHLVFGACLTVGGEYGVDFITLRSPVCRGVIARIPYQIFAVHNFEQFIPDALRETPTHHIDIVVGSTGVAWEEAAEIAIAPANTNARQRLASIVMLAEAHTHEVHHRLLHGEFHALPLARFETLDVRREN